MKKLLILAVALFGAAPLHAQSFVPSAGYSSQDLFNVGSGFTIGAFGASSSGDFYYLSTGNFTGTPTTKLLKRTVAGSFATATELFDYGASSFPAFVKVSGSTVYFGESSAGTIRSVDVSGGSSTTIATVPGVYDLAFRGSAAFVSVNPTWNPENKVFKLNLGTGQLDSILNTVSDYSGPLAFSSTGELLYGSTNFGGVAPAIYSFTSSEVDGVINADPMVSDTELLISDGDLQFANPSNQFFAYRDDAHLFHGYSGASAIVTRYNRTALTTETVGQAGGAGQFLGGLASVGSDLFVVVTSDFMSGPSLVVRVVPEPTSALLLVLAGSGIISRRLRRQAA